MIGVTTMGNSTGHAHRWTEAELKTLIAMWVSDDDIEVIAKHFNVTRHAINAQVWRMRSEGVPIPRRRAGTQAGRSHTPWTQEEVEFLVRRRRDGATAEQIGVELGRTFSAVQAMTQTLRKSGVQIRMFGSGKRRLWSPQSLQVAMAGRHLALVSEDIAASEDAA